MARPLRIEFSGALYHVTSRGDGREDIYLDEEDRELFMLVLGEVCDLFNWSVHSWCQMTNHYHLLVETPDSNLSKGMRYLNGVYTQRFNRKHSRVGHVFQGRYKAILVEKEPYLQELCRYIVLNPVRAGMTKSAERWEWSSYAATAGLASAPSWFDKHLVLGSFGKQQNVAIRRYMEFVANGVQQPSPWTMLKNQIYLGSDEFVERVQTNITDKKISEVPKIQKRPVPKAISEYAENAKSRNEAIQLAYRSGGYTLEAIGKYYGLHYSTVSRIIHDKMQK
ncbi:MAG: addiction module toxin RelE [Gammaproteobacteria bacterium]|nr:MAG: addiction module toxin RelE [Gammaproteobacteria bacterium]